MPRKHIFLADGFADAVDALSRTLAGGGVAVFPTETVYGIGVADGDADALAALRRLKGRDADKPFQRLAADIAMAERMGARFPSGALRLARRFWPGPLTLVVPSGGDNGTIGIRVPDSAFILAVLRELKSGIISSSANPAGSPPPLDAEAADAFPEGIDLLVDGGPCTVGTASTVVVCREDGYAIVREGALTTMTIAEAWRDANDE